MVVLKNVVRANIYNGNSDGVGRWLQRCIFGNEVAGKGDISPPQNNPASSNLNSMESVGFRNPSRNITDRFLHTQFFALMTASLKFFLKWYCDLTIFRVPLALDFRHGFYLDVWSELES